MQNILDLETIVRAGIDSNPSRFCELVWEFSEYHMGMSCSSNVVFREQVCLGEIPPGASYYRVGAYSRHLSIPEFSKDLLPRRPGDRLTGIIPKEVTHFLFNDAYNYLEWYMVDQFWNVLKTYLEI